MSTQEMVGYWWLPENSDSHIPGTLTISEKGEIDLSLMGYFSAKFSSDDPPHYPIVLGVTRGKEVTLADVRNDGGGSFAIPGFATLDFRVSVAYMGGHFENLDELRFAGARVEFAYLLEWMGMAAFYQRRPGWEARTREPHEIGYQLPEPVRAELPDGTIVFAHTISSSETFVEATLRKSAYIQVEGDEYRTLENWYDSFVRPIQNLLRLATTTRTKAFRLTLFFPMATELVDSGRPQRRPIEVFFRGIGPNEEGGKRLLRDRMLFTLQDMGDEPASILDKWLKMSQDLEGILNLYFSVRWNSDTYLEHQFLSMLQALEGYHGYRFGDEVLDPQEFQRQRKEILDALPTQFQGRISGLLNNNPSLKMRLTDLFDQVGDVSEPWIKRYGDKARLAQTISKKRGALTHPKHTDDAVDVEADDLYELTEALSFLFEACLLLDIGFEIQKVEQMFRKNQRYAFAVGRVAT